MPAIRQAEYHIGKKYSRNIKRKRKFYGNRFVKKKMASRREMNGEINIILDRAVFQKISDLVRCSKCHGQVKISTESFAGLGFKLKINCHNCFEIGSFDSSRMVGNSKNNIYEINLQSVVAMTLLGKGHRGLTSLCGVMNLPKPVNHISYRNHMRTIAQVSQDVAKSSLENAVEEESVLSDSKDIAVSGDGSWRKQGFSSLQGVISLIGNKSGKVVDVSVKNSFCRSCLVWEKKRDSAGYDEWAVSHECPINHDGSAGKMEPDGIVEMFRRSEANYGVRYSIYIGDGDTKTFRQLLDSRPYGPDFTIRKKECVGHVQKRLGTRLRKKKTELKSTKLADGGTFGGKGRMTANLIDTLTSYYGKAIRDNSDDIDKMERAIKAIFYHESSRDDDHNHQYCPNGKTSWCKYNRAIEEGDVSKYKYKYTPPQCVWDEVRPIFISLSTRELLERCVGGYTQNSNESLNSRIWKLAHKKTFSGMNSLKTAVYIAVSMYNDGSDALESLMIKLGINIGENIVKFLDDLDEKRVKRAASSRKETVDDQIDDNEEEDTRSEDSLHNGPMDVHYGAGIDEF